MKLSSSNIKTFLTFSQKKLLLYFGNRKPRKKFLKKFLILPEMVLFSLKLKKINTFQERTSHFLFVERELFKYMHKGKKFLTLSIVKKQNFLN